jgi:hypothetical protein
LQIHLLVSGGQVSRIPRAIQHGFEISRDEKSANSPGREQQAIISADVLLAEVIGRECGHHRQHATIRESGETQARNRAPEI